MIAPEEPGYDLHTWSTTTRQNGVGPGEVNDIRIVYVHGTRLVIMLAGDPGLSRVDRATMESVLESIDLGG